MCKTQPREVGFLDSFTATVALARSFFRHAPGLYS